MDGQKTCTKCGDAKDTSAFSRHASTRDGFRPDCKTCCRAYHNSLYRRQRTGRLAKARAEYADDPDKFRSRNHVRYAEDESYRDSVKARASLRHDSAYAIRRGKPIKVLEDRIRTRLRKVLNERGLNKRRKTFELLGYMPQELWAHLEPYLGKHCECGCGTIVELDSCHIDHIIPLLNARTEEELIELNALTNLRLICASCNLHREKRAA